LSVAGHTSGLRLVQLIMKTFDVQAVEINAPRETVFSFVRDPRNLPRWTHAFASADAERARLRTPRGEIDIALQTITDRDAGTIDWRMQFPDGTVGVAHSRVVESNPGTCIYSFVLHAPPVPLEQLEGALEVQSKTLRDELATLRGILQK
jgi:uncharacterized protein YndB with AHSA1/START domain